jgi:hypothetical protein
MLKKIIYLALVIIIVAGAAYSYKKVDFRQKTAMLYFSLGFGSEDGTGALNGPPGGKKGFPPGGKKGPPPTLSATQGTAPPGGTIPQGERSMLRNPRTGKLISLNDVIAYTFILAFFVMVTRFLDLFIRKVCRKEPSN